ncbi:hypothetical protein PGB90_002636 [Kerria lacca]
MSTVEAPVLAVRGSTGILIYRGPPSYDPVSSFPAVTSKRCKAMVFSPNGEYFAWFDGVKEPQYSKDEEICVRCIDGQVLFYEKGNFETPSHKINSPKVDSFSLSPGSVYHVLCYMPGNSGPSFGKLFKYPNFTTAVANKTFFKSDKVDMYWNNKGTNVLLLTSTETDKSGASYYGKQSLHFLSVTGDTAIVLMNQDGPIHNVNWSPVGEEFCVVYGYMPAKAALFNSKCEVVHDFGTGPRNSIYFNPHGNNILLLQWSPDGVHFVTATTAPRLRVDNGFKIYHYSGTLLYERPWNKQEELWEVIWQVFPENKFKKPTISFKQVEGIQTNDAAAKEVYRPPAARGLPSSIKFSLHEEADTSKSPQLSKICLKMKRKRESKRQAKLQQQNQSTCTNISINNGHSNSTNGEELRNTRSNNKGNTNQSDKITKIRKLKTNLKSIKKLKELQSSGKDLDNHQLLKISREADLLKELETLQL